MAPRFSRWFWATLFLGVVTCTSTADTNTQVAPEMWGYLDVSDRARLFFLANLSDNVTQSSRDETVGVHLDIALKPILRHRLRVSDWAREKYLWVRVGYRRNFGGSTRETGVLEANSRFALPLGLWTVSRLRTDLRAREECQVVLRVRRHRQIALAHVYADDVLMALGHGVRARDLQEIGRAHV